MYTLTYRQIATYFGVSCSTISNTMNGIAGLLGLQVNRLSEQENTKVLMMLEAIVHHFDIPGGDPEVSVLAESTEPERLVRQIDKVIEKEAQLKTMDNGNEP